jgi:VWFA-related protein
MRMIFIVLLTVFALPALADDNHDTPTFRSGVSDVRVDVRATQAGNPITDLTKDDFAVFDNSMVQSLSYFGHDREPVSVLLLLDVSGSMQPLLQEMAAKAREALDLLRPGDQVAIMVFGKRTAAHQDFFDNLAESARQIGVAVTAHDVGVGTAINAAVIDAAAYIKTHLQGSPGRRAVLIVTDNLCLNFRTPDQKVLNALQSADAVLDAIVTGRAIRPGPPKPGQNYNTDFTPADVFLLAEKSGGQAIKSDRTGESLRHMIEAIRGSYSLAYHLPGGMPGTFRHIEVRLAPEARRRYPGAALQYRTGYLVPSS